MRRSLVLLLLATIGLVFLGSTGWIESDDCLTACQDENDGGDCAPDCRVCGCCAVVRTLIPPPIEIATVLAAAGWNAPPPAARPCAGAPRGVFHVPKSLVA